MRRIKLTVDAAVGRITLARPEKRNALDRAAADEILQSVRELEGNPSVRVIVLAAEGVDFCAGADLQALREMLDADIRLHEEDANALGNAFNALHDARCPTVALVQGRALAGGAALATACDMILAHEEARFGYPETGIGFVPAMAMALLVRSVGEKVAFDLVATGRVIDAAEAHRIGMISRVCRASDFVAGSDALVASLAAKPQKALAVTKELLHRVRNLNLHDGIAAGAHANAAARTTADFRAAVLRFTEKL